MLHPCELQALMVGNHVTDWNKLQEVGMWVRMHAGFHTGFFVVVGEWEDVMEYIQLISTLV